MALKILIFLFFLGLVNLSVKLWEYGHVSFPRSFVFVLLLTTYTLDEDCLGLNSGSITKDISAISSCDLNFLFFSEVSSKLNN